MKFQKGNKLGATKRLPRQLGEGIVAFRPYVGQKEGLKLVPDWQERFREFADQLISNHQSSASKESE